MMKIPLTYGKYAIIDDEDFECVSGYKWHTVYNKKTKLSYAQTHMKTMSGKQLTQTLLMHRLILNLKAGDGQETDHINHDTLDNRRCNIRICSRSQNMMNRKGPQCNSKSGVLGVYWDITKKKWVSTICINKKVINIGNFKHMEDALGARITAEEHYYEDYKTDR